MTALQNEASSDEVDKDKPMDSKKGNDADHGNRFQSKLLMLFFLRAINQDYDFYLGTELPYQGAKFDDLILKYRKKTEESNGTLPNSSTWSYQYLQAKHRLHENESTFINETDLLEDTGDFSIAKYFRSYLELSRRGDKIDSCIICTNVDIIDHSLLEIKEDNTLKILTFEGFKKKTENVSRRPICYKLKTQEQNKSLFEKKLRDKFQDCTISHFLAKKLHKYATTNKILNSEDETFRHYHMALIQEKVFDLQQSGFHQMFIHSPSTELTEGPRELQKALNGLKTKTKWDTWKFKRHTDEAQDTFGKVELKPKKFNYKLPIAVKEDEVRDFLAKFVFAVNTPNEDELTDILDNEMGKYFNLKDVKVPSGYIYTKMVNWFKKQTNKWLSAEEGKKLFLDSVKETCDSHCATALSITYQKELVDVLSYNDEAVEETARTLQPRLESRSNPEDERQTVLYMTTSSPKLTAIKVIAALKHESISPNYDQNDSYLVTSSSRLSKGYERDWMRNAMLNKQNPQQLLIVVRDCNIESEETLFSQEEVQSLSGRRVILIIGKKDMKGNQQFQPLNDTIRYGQLSESSKQALLCKSILFQKKPTDVSHLVEQDQHETVIDAPSIEELMLEGKPVVIGLNKQNVYRYSENSPFIKRQLSTQLEAEPCVSQQEELISQESEKSIIIITGINGSGKSTLLSHYYKMLIENNPDLYWVIHLDQSDISEALSELKFPTANKYIDFFVVAARQKSPFARSLLNYRLQMGNRVAILLDGFDNISSQCQDMVIQLIKSSINAKPQSKRIRLYVTTGNLHDTLASQFANHTYSLKTFSRENQIEYLTKLWQRHLKAPADEDENKLQKNFFQFAQLLVNETIKTLATDEEQDFMSTPVKCYHFAMCFKSIVSLFCKNKLKQSEIKEFLVEPDLIIVYSYLHFLKTKKRDIRRQREEKDQKRNEAAKILQSVMDTATFHYFQLAVKTVFTNKDDAKILCPSFDARSYASAAENRKIEKTNVDCGLQFGWTFRKRDGSIMLAHRTLAEYLIAEFLYEGFLFDPDQQKQLLDKEPVRNLIVHKILVNKEYKGVRTYLNFLLKRIVWNKKWRIIVANHSCTDPSTTSRLETFLKAFRETQQRGEYVPEYKALCVAAEEKKSNIFVLLLDCIETTQKRNATKVATNNRLSIFHFQYETEFIESSNNYDDCCKEANEGAVKRLLRSAKAALLDSEEQQGEVHRGRLLRFISQKEIGRRADEASCLKGFRCENNKNKLKMVLEIMVNEKFKL